MILVREEVFMPQTPKYKEITREVLSTTDNRLAVDSKVSRVDVDLQAQGWSV